MVCNHRPVYQEEHAAQLIMAKRDCSPLEGRIHLRRPVDRPFAFSLQSRGGPYISREEASWCPKLWAILSIQQKGNPKHPEPALTRARTGAEIGLSASSEGAAKVARPESARFIAHHFHLNQRR